MGFGIKTKGWSDGLPFIDSFRDMNIKRMLRRYGKEGVEALELATPKDTGKTASSWSYEIETTDDGYNLVWNNSNMAEPGMPIAILLQYGHATKAGTYVRGVDYINPALSPVFQKIADNILDEVIK